MRHAILGPGGVGGLIAASLAESGATVTLVVRNEAIGQYPGTLQLESPFGKFSVGVERTTTVPAAALPVALPFTARTLTLYITLRSMVNRVI